jgi:hypothetical protein
LDEDFAFFFFYCLGGTVGGTVAPVWSSLLDELVLPMEADTMLTDTCLDGLGFEPTVIVGVSCL